MPITYFFQTFFQDRKFFRQHGITHIQRAAFYFTPCDAQGRPVTVCDQPGGAIDGYETAGCYHSLAVLYDDAGALEPKPVSRETKGSGSRRATDRFRYMPG